MAIFGFNGEDARQQNVIVALRARADRSSTKIINTLAQYEITDVKITPVTYDVEHVNKLQLVINSKLKGMNNSEGLAVMMHGNREISDTYPLSKEWYGKMVVGGLYDNPLDFERALSSKMKGSQYYRSTQASIESLLVKDNESQISVGDFGHAEAKYTRYYIGRDLVVTRDLSAEKRTNFEQALQPAVNDLIKSPIKEQDHEFDYVPVYDSEPSVQTQAEKSVQTELPTLMTDGELNISPKSSSAAIDTPSLETKESESSVESLKPIMTQGEMNVIPQLGSADFSDMSELVAALNSQANKAQHIQSPSYADDYADMIQVSRQQKQHRRSAAVDLAKHENNKQEDTGLER